MHSYLQRCVHPFWNKCTQVENSIVLIETSDESDVFGYNIGVLHDIYARRTDKTYRCQNCNDRLTKFDGKMCCVKHCCDPNNPEGINTAWHNRCLISVDWSKYTICPLCAYVLWKKEYQFRRSGNIFINRSTYSLIYYALYHIKCVTHFSINNEIYVFFIGKYRHINSGDIYECYFIEKRDYIFSLQTRSDRNKLLPIYSEWLTNYQSPAQRDQYELDTRTYYNVMPDPYDGIIYPKIHIQFMRNQCTQNILGWYAIDGIDCIPGFDEKIVDFSCQRLWDEKNHCIINEKQEIYKNTYNPGAYFRNQQLAMYSIRMSYKFNKTKFYNHYKDQFHHRRYGDYQTYRIPNDWDNNNNQELHKYVVAFNSKLNKLLQHLVYLDPEIFWQFNDIIMRDDGMGAILFYDKDQKKHIDADDLMMLHHKQLGHSALWMRNGAVNAQKIVSKPIPSKPNESIFIAIDSEDDNPKTFCFDLDVNQCKHGATKNKHMSIRKGTTVIGIPPDVATAVHQAHDIMDNTIVLTVRGVAPELKSASDDVDALTQWVHDFNTKSDEF